jgi:K+-sensing histidine kinase KdpD
MIDQVLLDRLRPWVISTSVALPVLICALLATGRTLVSNSAAALILTLVIVAAAATGIRAAGMLAAVSSAASYDFFLTIPYSSFKIDSREDVEVTVLLILVGAAVTEVALWGRRQQARASREAGQLDGVLTTVGLVAASRESTTSLADQVGSQIVELLAIDRASFDPQTGVGGTDCVLQQDGSITRSGQPVNVDRDGLPVDTTIVLLAQSGGQPRGRYVLTAATRVSRPTLQQRRVAIALADQVGADIAGRAGGRTAPTDVP